MSSCLITTPRTVITVSRSNTRDVARAKRVCEAVAAQHGLVPRVNDRGLPPEVIGYATPIHSPSHRYTSPELDLNVSPQNSAVVVIGDRSDSAARRKLADDTLFALQREFGAKRVQRRDDRWTEF
jgi:hypothetical protein